MAEGVSERSGQPAERPGAELNWEAIQREQEEFAEFVLKRNRHNSGSGIWYGPAPEPRPAGPDCGCPGCNVRYDLPWT